MTIAQLAELLLAFRRDFDEFRENIEKKVDTLSEKTAMKFADIEEKLADMPTRAEFNSLKGFTATGFDAQTGLILGFQADVAGVLHRQDRIEKEFVRR